MASYGIFAEDDEEQATPLAIAVCGLVEHDRDEGPNMDDGGGLRPESLVGGFVLV